MKVLSLPPLELWEEVVRGSPCATFFHTPTWVGVLEKTYPRYRNATLGFIFEDGNRAIFPMVVEGGGLFKRVKHKSMALGVYGGIVAERRLTSRQLEEAVHYLTSQDISDLRVVENPFERYPFPPDFAAKEMSTHILTLSDDFEQVMKRISRGRQRNMREAERKGVKIRLAESLKDFERYYESYREQVEHWGDEAGTTYPWELFLFLFETHHPGIRLWLAEKGEKVIAGILAFYWNRTILLWHGYSHSEYLTYYPSSLLHREIIKDGCARGYRVYDLNPSVGRRGVVQFKESLAARKVDFRVYHWRKRRALGRD